MKKFTIKIALIFSVLFLNSCGLLGDKISPSAALEATKTSSGAVIGSVFTIPAAGGTANIVSATAKVTVPAGTMTTALSIQANADMLDGEGQGISLTGDWTKPITVEFAIPSGVTDPENYKIGLRLSNGYWVTCRKAKINTTNNTVQVRIAPSIKAKSATKARPMANSYSLAFAKTFYLKPDHATVKLGEKVNFTAYAREGTIPVKFGDKTFDSQDEFDAALKTLAELGDDPINDDDELVPLPNLDAKDNDELVPLTIIAKEFPFSNKKAGFTRTWTAKSLGSIVASGNAGADYTAPKDEAAKGKTVKVQFSSINDKTKRKADAEATVRIEDGLTRYTGTVTITDTREFINSNYTTTDIRKLTSKVELVQDNATGTLFKHSLVQQGNKTVSSSSTKVIAFSSEDSDGLRWQRFTSDQSPPNDGGLIYVEFAKDFKTYKIDGDLGGFCQIQGKGQNAPVSTTNDFSVSANILTGYAFKLGPSTDVGTTLDNLSGKLLSTTKTTKQTTTVTTEWNLQKLK